MKTVITSGGNTLAAPFDIRFGRAAWFCFYDDETGEVSFQKNEFGDTGDGAGARAAEKMAQMNVSKVISGDFGPKAKDLLDKSDIQMVIIPDGDRHIGAIIDRLKS